MDENGYQQINRSILKYMTRFPANTPYVGPTMCYDEQIDPDQLLRRLAYGRAAPLLGYRARMDTPFFGKLIDGLSNSHSVLVKASPAEQTCRNVAARLRNELPPELFSIGILPDPERNEWLVMAYNNVPKELRTLPTRFSQRGPNWIGVKEVARVLKLQPAHARAVVLASPVEYRRTGGRNEIMVRQRDLPILVNRPRRWRRRKKTA